MYMYACLRLHERVHICSYATEKAARAEILLPSEQGYIEAEGINKTWRFKQDEIAKNVDSRTNERMFNLTLDEYGPYSMDYTRNGRHLLMGGRKGHIAMVDWQNKHLKTEFNVQETIRDIKFLHNEDMFAVAQKKYVYIYDKSGMELHRLKNHIEPNK